MPRVIALAGRRIDDTAIDAPRFPLSHAARVRGRVREVFIRERPAAVVCSAACGADLLALDEAAALGIRRRVVLPRSIESFRAESVVNRPGDWGAIFDRTIADAKRSGDLVVLEGGAADEWDAYIAANRRILDEASTLVPAATVIAVLVWEGASRGEEDVTAEFGTEAADRGCTIVHVSTR